MTKRPMHGIAILLVIMILTHVLQVAHEQTNILHHEQIQNIFSLHSDSNFQKDIKSLSTIHFS